MSVQVLTCPFCASARAERTEGNNYRWVKVCCVDCGACGPEVRVDDNASAAELAWNARKPTKSKSLLPGWAIVLIMGYLAIATIGAGCAAPGSLALAVAVYFFLKDEK